LIRRQQSAIRVQEQRDERHDVERALSRHARDWATAVRAVMRKLGPGEITARSWIRPLKLSCMRGMEVSGSTTVSHALLCESSAL